MNPAQMAGGVPPQAPPQAGQAGSQLPPSQAAGGATISPGQAQAPNTQKITQVLEVALKQVVDKNGYVDMNKLVILWPQVSQQAGLNIPFQTVLQMLQQDPSMIEGIIQQMGLAGIIVNGKAKPSKRLEKSIEIAIEEIKKDIVDDIYVTLKGSDGLRQVQCYFDNKEIAAKLQKGMNVVFKGKCDGLMMNVIMKDCELVPLD
jgi:hypothetical protein